MYVIFSEVTSNNKAAVGEKLGMLAGFGSILKEAMSNQDGVTVDRPATDAWQLAPLPVEPAPLGPFSYMDHLVDANDPDLESVSSCIGKSMQVMYGQDNAHDYANLLAEVKHLREENAELKEQLRRSMYISILMQLSNSEAYINL